MVVFDPLPVLVALLKVSNFVSKSGLVSIAIVRYLSYGEKGGFRGKYSSVFTQPLLVKVRF